MLSSQSKSLTPTSLRAILAILIVVLVVAGAAAFIFIRLQLSDFATQVQLENAAASASSEDVTRLKQLEEELSSNEVAVNRAKKIVADSQSYQYQDQIIADLNAYAQASGVVIENFTFNNENVDDGSADAAAAPPPEVTGEEGAVEQSTTPAGLKSTTASITIKNPVEYIRIMNFINSIEQNLTKMQVSGISIAKSSDDPSGRTVNINPLTIEVYIR